MGAGAGPGLRGSLSGLGSAEAGFAGRWWGEQGGLLLRRARSWAGGSSHGGDRGELPPFSRWRFPGRAGAAAPSARVFTFGAGVENPTDTWVSYLRRPKNWVCTLL